MDHESPPVIERFDGSTILRMALDMLGQRAFKWAVFLAAFGLFAYAAWRPHVVTLLAASIFTLMTHVPLAWREKGR